jgi:hypothetical protein
MVRRRKAPIFGIHSVQHPAVYVALAFAIAGAAWVVAVILGEGSQPYVAISLGKEVSMKWSAWIRQIHRWVSIVFVAVVIGIFIAVGVGEKPANWVYLSPLLPLALLALTGLYLFALPYAAKWRSKRQPFANE